MKFMFLNGITPVVLFFLAKIALFIYIFSTLDMRVLSALKWPYPSINSGLI